MCRELGTSDSSGLEVMTSVVSSFRDSRYRTESASGVISPRCNGKRASITVLRECWIACEHNGCLEWHISTTVVLQSKDPSRYQHHSRVTTQFGHCRTLTIRCFLLENIPILGHTEFRARTGGSRYPAAGCLYEMMRGIRDDLSRM